MTNIDLIDIINNTKVIWWKKFLPFINWDSNLRLLEFIFTTKSYYVKPITKKHFFDVLILNNKKWWQIPICGFYFWL